MSTVAIVLIAIGGLLLVLFLGGLIANARVRRAEGADLRRQLREADRALAAARAEDRGWDRLALEAAAREAFAAGGGGAIEELMLVRVVDRPGVEEDLAIFRVMCAGTPTEITLGRIEGAWGPVD